MGLPNISIAFKTAAAAAVQLSQKGVVGLIIKDSKKNGPTVITSTTEIPEEFEEANREYITRTFYGYVNAPSKVILYTLPKEPENLSEALNYMATQTIDYLVGPPDTDSTEAGDHYMDKVSMEFGNGSARSVAKNRGGSRGDY